MTMKFVTTALLTLSLTILTLLSCGGDDPPTGGDNTPPTVKFINPSDEDINVAVTENISVSFSEKINGTTVTSNNFQISPVLAGNLSLVQDSIIIFEPTGELNYDTEYLITVTTGIADLAGNKLASNYSFSFRTIKDYSSLIPTIISSSPIDGELDVAVSKTVEVTFSEYMNSSTFDETTFYIEGVTGSFSFTQLDPSLQYRVSFNPTADLQYDTTYDLIITTGVQDNYGNSLAQNDTISFTTEKLKPSAFVVSPADSSIGTGLVDFLFGATHPIGLDKYEFYVDDVLADQFVGNVGSHTFTFDFSALEIGTIHQFYAMVYDTAGNSDTTSVINMYAHWEVLAVDGNDGYSPLEVPNDVRRILGRSTDSTLELRIEYAYNWQHPYVDTAVDLGLFFDTDLNGQTGRRDAAADSLNGIGADHRIILGLHGGDTCLSYWDANSVRWELTYDTTGLIYHNLPQDTNFMEIGLFWDDMNVAQAVYLVGVNVYFPDQNDPNFFITDFIPDRGAGFITIRRAARLVGNPAPVAKSGVPNSALSAPAINILNPFN